MRRPRAGLLVPYVPFYEGIVPLREEKRAFAADLQRTLSKSSEVLSPGLVETEDEAREAARLFREREADAVIVAPALAAFGGMAWAALESCECPVLLWCVQPAEKIPDDWDMRQLIRNSGGLAVQAIANTLARAGRKFDVVFSRTPERVSSFLRAAAVSKDLKKARFGRIGTVFPWMTDIALDAPRWPGAEIREVAANALHGCYLRQGEDEVAARVAGMRARHAILDITDNELERSARLWLTLDEIVHEHGLDGGAFNCHGENCLRNHSIGVTACYAVSAQTSEGRPFSCTGDLPTAIAMWMLNQLAGSVIYGELDLVDADANCVLLANGGEGLCEGASIAGNENFVGVHGRGASLRFTPFTGPATLASFTPLDCSGRYRIIATEGEMAPRELPGFGVFHSGFRFNGVRAPRAFELWCEAGAVHHIAIAPGHWARELRWIAEFSGFEFMNPGGRNEA